LGGEKSEDQKNKEGYKRNMQMQIILRVDLLLNNSQIKFPMMQMIKERSIN